MTLRTLNYGNYGIFLIMGNAGFCPSAVSIGLWSFVFMPRCAPGWQLWMILNSLFGFLGGCRAPGFRVQGLEFGLGNA